MQPEIRLRTMTTASRTPARGGCGAGRGNPPGYPIYRCAVTISLLADAISSDRLPRGTVRAHGFTLGCMRNSTKYGNFGILANRYSASSKARGNVFGAAMMASKRASTAARKRSPSPTDRSSYQSIAAEMSSATRG